MRFRSTLLAFHHQTPFTMAKEPGTYSAASLYLTAAVCVACGAALYYFFKPPCPPPPDAPEPVRLDLIAYFDSEDIGTMLGSEGTTGVRFYLAKDAAGALTSVAAPTKEDGQHNTDASGELSFYMFKALSGSTTDLDIIDEATATDVVRRASSSTKPTYSIDVKVGALRKLLGAEGCNGIGLLERNTTLEDWTFDVVPVKIADDAATAVGSVAEMAVGLPCPMYCGSDPSYYLHMR